MGKWESPDMLKVLYIVYWDCHYTLVCWWHTYVNDLLNEVVRGICYKENKTF